MYCWRDNVREFQCPGLKQNLRCKWQKNSTRTCCLILLIEMQSLVHEVLLKQMVSIPFLCAALQSGVPDAGDFNCLALTTSITSINHTSCLTWYKSTSKNFLFPDEHLEEMTYLWVFFFSLPPSLACLALLH